MLGGGAGRILIAVSDEAHPFLPEGSLTFLTTILGACKRSLADIQLINTVRAAGWSGEALLLALAPERVLLFGTPLQGWPIPGTLPHYELFSRQGCSFLTAPPLALLESDKEEKTRLWKCLKILFAL